MSNFKIIAPPFYDAHGANNILTVYCLHASITSICYFVVLFLVLTVVVADMWTNRLSSTLCVSLRKQLSKYNVLNEYKI